jgi:hypothetical protein
MNNVSQCRPRRGDQRCSSAKNRMIIDICSHRAIIAVNRTANSSHRDRLASEMYLMKSIIDRHDRISLLRVSRLGVVRGFRTIAQKNIPVFTPGKVSTIHRQIKKNMRFIKAIPVRFGINFAINTGPRKFPLNETSAISSELALLSCRTPEQSDRLQSPHRFLGDCHREKKASHRSQRAQGTTPHNRLSSKAIATARQYASAF